MMFAESTIPTWQSTVAVLAMCASGAGFLISVGVLYFMKAQTTAMREQTEVIRQQASQPTQIQQPVEVTVTEELHQLFAGKRDFENHVTETRGEFARITRERSDDLRLAAQSRRTMYEKQDALRREMTERTDAVRKDLGEKIDGIPERVIATLKNTGAI